MDRHPPFVCRAPWVCVKLTEERPDRPVLLRRAPACYHRLTVQGEHSRLFAEQADGQRHSSAGQRLGNEAGFLSNYVGDMTMKTMRYGYTTHSGLAATGSQGFPFMKAVGFLSTATKIGGVMMLASCIRVASATAEEGQIPFKAGVSIDVPVGKLPAPGLYYSWGVQYFSLNVKNDQGANVGVRQRSILDDNFFVYVPDMPTIFGARYGAFFDQSVSAGSTGSRAGTATNFGLVNTVISPVTLSWDLGHGFFASAGFTFYPPGPNYHTTDGNHINRPQSSFEPGLGLSYLANGLNLTIHPVFDINTVDPANGYLSGSVFVMDFSGTYKIQKFEFGGAGTIVAQVSDDKQHGVTVAGVAGVRGYGNRAQGVNVGPILGYDLGVATARVYYTRSVYGRNIATDDRYYFRLDFPISGQKTARAPRNDSEGAR